MEDTLNKELDTLGEELMADAIREDALEGLPEDTTNPEGLIDADQDGIEQAVLSDDSDADTETTAKDNGNDADLSVNEDEEIKTKEDTEPVEEVAEETEEAKETASTTKQSKSDDRYDRNWKKFQEEKDEVRSQLPAKDEEIAKMQKQINELTSKQAEAERPLSSSEYMQLSKHYEEEGKYEDAEQAKANADTRRSQEVQELSKLQDTSKETVEVDQKEWWDNAGKYINESPNKDLADANSVIGKRVKGLLDGDPRFMQQKDGFALATHIAEGELASTSLADKNAKIAQLSKELKQYKKLTEVGGSSANSQTTSPINANKSLEQEGDELMREARREDSMAIV